MRSREERQEGEDTSRKILVRMGRGLATRAESQPNIPGHACLSPETLHRVGPPAIRLMDFSLCYWGCSPRSNSRRV